jgi:Spy/CpxP family protein refolding chaperone
MKKLLLLPIFAALLAAPAFAQETKDKEKDKQKDYSEWQKKIKEELKLTDEQTAKWDALNKEYKEKTDAAVQAAGEDKDAQKAKKMELKKEKEAKFLELLTPEQQTRYREMIDQKKKESEASKPAGN